MRPEKIWFLLDEKCPLLAREEAEKECRDLRSSGFSAEVTGCGLLEEKLPERALFLTDNAEMLERLRKAEKAVAGYSYEGMDIHTLRGAAYILSEPCMVEDDDYIKIYERLTGQPWTVLETERCVVRETTGEDAPEIAELYDAYARRFLEPPAEEETERRNLESYREKIYAFYGYGMWSVLEKETGRLIGRMGYEPYERGREAVSFGYLLHPSVRGKGIAGEAAKSILEYGKTCLGLKTVEAYTHAENTASIQLLAKTGFRLMGIEEKSGLLVYQKDLR